MSKRTKHPKTRALVTSMVAGLALSQVACGAADPNDPGGGGTTTQAGSAAAPAPTQPYDGETIFRGVFLGQGPVAKLLPEIWENPDVLRMRDEARRMTPAQAADRLEASAQQVRASGDAAHAEQLLTLASRIRAGETDPQQAAAALPGADEAAVERALMTSIRDADPGFFTRFAADMQSGDHVRVENALANAATVLANTSPWDVESKYKTPAPQCFSVLIGVAAVAGYVAVWAVGAVVQVAALWNYTWAWNGSHTPSRTEDLQRDVIVDDLTLRLGVAAAHVE